MLYNLQFGIKYTQQYKIAQSLCPRNLSVQCDNSVIYLHEDCQLPQRAELSLTAKITQVEDI